jgi:hypothetical protein
MCKRNTVAYGDYIGKQRLVGWCVWNGKDFSFLSDKQVKARLQIKEFVNGLALDTEGNVVIDQTFTNQLMGKSGLTFSPISVEGGDDEDEAVMNKYYALVKVVKGKAGNQYHFITNRCGQEAFDEQQVKAMLSIMPLGGVQMDEKGQLIVHKGVEVVDVEITPADKAQTEGKK